jgi:predicted O-methyltransferase YrrM
MLFVGEDTVLPFDGFINLHKTAEANPNSIVTGVYYFKGSNPMIMVRKGDHIAVPNVDPGQIIEAWQTGMDAMLIPVEVLRRLYDEDPEIPFCCIGHGIDNLPFIGEDNFFVYRMRKMGVKLLVDTNVQCLHMDLASGKYTAHPSVNLKNYITNIPVTEPITLQDKKYIDGRWTDRLPEGSVPIPAKMIPQLLNKIISKENEKLEGIEIGVFAGDSSKYLLETIPELTLYGIDPYTNYVDWNGISHGNMDEARKITNKKLDKFDDRFRLIQNISDNATHFFKDNSMDFIFIDGLHTYGQVLKDCENYYVKLKEGGLFCGHDFTNVEAVGKAVKQFAKSIGKEIFTTENDVWFFYK